MSSGNSTSSSSTDSTNASFATLASSLIFNLVIAAAYYAAFCILRPANRNVFAPRTYIVSKEKRSKPLPPGLFSWILPTLRTKEMEVIHKAGLDAYAMMRYNKISLFLFSVFTVFGLAIIMPLNAVNQGTQTGLNQLTMGNITDPHRLWGHLIIAWLFVGLTIFVLRRELITFLHLRHAYLLSPGYRTRLAARTILVTQIPKRFRVPGTLERLFSEFGQVERVTPVLPFEKAEEKYDFVKQWAKSLEDAECAYIRTGKRPKVVPATVKLDLSKVVQVKTLKKVADKTTQGLKIAAEQTGKGIAIAAEQTGKGITVAAEKTGKGIITAADKTVHGIANTPAELAKLNFHKKITAGVADNESNDNPFSAPNRIESEHVDRYHSVEIQEEPLEKPILESKSPNFNSVEHEEPDFGDSEDEAAMEEDTMRAIEAADLGEDQTQGAEAQETLDKDSHKSAEENILMRPVDAIKVYFMHAIY